MPNVENLVRRNGVPAFAYPAHDASTPWLCKLKIIHRNTELTISLEHRIDVDGEQQLITLRYEGDNLVPGRMSLEHRDIKIPAEPFSGTLRQGNPETRLLSLTLKKACSVWYPKCSKLNTSFQRLLTLARATEVCICFDTRWLGENTAEFLEIVRSSRGFDGVPLIPQFTSLYQKADWQILNFITAAESRSYIPNEDSVSVAIPSIEDVEAEAPPFEDVVHDNPPPYAHDVLGKRSRPDSSLTLDAQDSKRARGHSCSSSETELATSEPSLRAESTASSTTTVPVDLFQQAVTSAVEKALSPMLKKEVVQVVRQELPQVVAELFRKTPADHSPSRCLSPASPCNQIPNPLTHHDMTPAHHPTLSTMMKEAVTTAVHEALDETLHETLDRHHQSVTMELEEYSNDLKIGLEASNEDHMVHCNDELNEMEAEFEQHLVDSLEDFKDFADEVVVTTENRLNKLGKTMSNQTFCGCGNVLVASKQSQRATSLPVSRYDKENYGGSMK